MFSMADKKIICKQCKKEFTVVKFNPSYPRKYCDPCSKQRKKWWDNRHLIKYEDCEDD